MKLRLIPRASQYYGRGPAVDIRVDSSGVLKVTSKDLETTNAVLDLLKKSLYYPGRGYPRYRRDESGQMVRHPDTGRYELLEYVDHGAPDAELLAAVEDSLTCTNGFDMRLHDDACPITADDHPGACL